MKNRVLLSIILSTSIFAGVLLLDLLTKGLIIPNLIPSVGDSVDVIPGFINFIYVKNTGAAWGIFGGRPVFLILISIIILALFITFYVLRVKKVGNRSSCLLAISVGLIAGGCLGNLFDRIVFGYVRDFINFQFMDFPVFNFADIALTFGVIIMVIYFLFSFSKEEKEDGKIKMEIFGGADKIDDNSCKFDEKTAKNDEIREIVIDVSGEGDDKVKDSADSDGGDVNRLNTASEDNLAESEDVPNKIEDKVTDGRTDKYGDNGERDG